MTHLLRAQTALAFAFAAMTWCNLALCADDGPATPADSRNSAERPPDVVAPKPLRIGAIGGMGFPRPLAIEAMVVFNGRLAIGAEYGTLPAMSIDSVRVSLWSVTGDVRVFPFRGAFYVGLRAGHQRVDASTSIPVRSIGSASEELALDSWLVNPRMGFLWTSREGLTFGVEAGLQIPIGAVVSSTLPLSLDPSAQNTANTIGNTLIPTVDLFRLGLLL
ncbi:MAG: hypothetical protein M3O46_17575 [Myxococcota bacterium]|nr:hypothetical protein [Myxococcota bacterium]